MICRYASALGRAVASFRADDRGAATILIGLLTPLAIGALSIAVDTRMWYAENRKLQHQAEMASTGAVRALEGGASIDVAKTAAMDSARRNGYAADHNSTFIVNTPPTSGPDAGKSNAIEIVITKKLPLFFSAIFFTEQNRLRAQSVRYHYGMPTRIADPKPREPRVALPRATGTTVVRGSGATGVR